MDMFYNVSIKPQRLYILWVEFMDTIVNQRLELSSMLSCLQL